MTEANRLRFNAEAAEWDTNPVVQIASAHARDAILAAHPHLTSTSPTKPTHVLEIGCGTGLLSLLLAPHVSSLLAVDASEGMIAALQAKLSLPTAPSNVHPLCIMLEDPEDPRLLPSDTSASSPGSRRKFDLAVSHLTMHHIPSMPTLLRTIYGCLRPGTGEVCVTDFEDFGPEARRFHPESRMAGVERDGLRQEEMRRILEEVGFVDVSVEVGWVQEKEVERTPGEWDGGKPPDCEKAMFPFLVIRGRRGV